jgi:hypothetical protein
MKSSIKILFIIFFFFINFVRCEIDPPCGPENTLAYFDIKGLKVSNINGSGLSATINEEVEITKYNLALSLEVTYYSSITLSGFSTVACTPAVGNKGSKEKIDYIKVSCDKDYDAKHLANSSLNDITLVGSYSSEKAPSQKLDERIKENNYTPKSLNEYILTFKTPPTKKQNIIFTVEYALTNGEKYTAKTLPVIIY